MYTVAYFIPLAATVTLFAIRGDLGHWWLYLIMLTCAELLLWLVRYLFAKSTAKEFCSYYVTAVHHEFEWVERCEHQETVTDRNGNSHTETRVEYITHPDEWNLELNNRVRKDITAEKFIYFCEKFNTGVYHETLYHHNCVKGGDGEYCLWNGNPYDTETVTDKQNYYNPIRYSHSIFKTETISKQRAKELGLYDYPKNEQNSYDHYVVLDRDNLLDGNDVKSIQKEFQLLNAFEGYSHQIHVFVLLYDAQKYSLEVVEEQRAYWFNGNKNEFVVCLGVEGKEVTWSNTFSWMDFDTPTLGIATNRYFLEHAELNLELFCQWLRSNLDFWKRKEAKDLKYLGINLSQKKTAWLFVVAAALSAIIVWITLQFIPVKSYF